MVQIIRDTSLSIYDFEVDLVFNRPVDIEKINIFKDIKVEVINKKSNLIITGYTIFINKVKKIEVKESLRIL